MKRFSRRTEDFICEHCGTKVTGNGYTNHCPQCLYSKHVDVNPGDRSSDCGGLMEPIDIEQKDGSYIVVQRCQQCGFIRRNKVSSEDNFDSVLNIIRQKAIRLRSKA